MTEKAGGETVKGETKSPAQKAAEMADAHHNAAVGALARMRARGNSEREYRESTAEALIAALLALDHRLALLAEVTHR